MLNDVHRLIIREGMLMPGQPVWVAVSGGVDSMVLLHVLGELGYICHVAHVDHGLRGEESRADRAFVADHAHKKGLRFRVKEVHPSAVSKGESVQMAARRLRYAWFKELLQEGPAKLALGHHRDDVVETLVLNLLRGAGPKGWAGIPPVTPLGRGEACRPLLDVRRKAILAYAREHGIAFREDASNADPGYLRNRVRHEVLPLLERLRPGAGDVMARETRTLREMSLAAQAQVEQEAEDFPRLEGGKQRIPLDTLLKSRNPGLLLRHLIGAPAPHPKQVDDLLEAVEQRATGTEFFFHGRRISLAHGELWIDRPGDGLPTIRISLARKEQGAANGFSWQLCKPEAVDLERGMHTAWLDTERLGKELVLRPWRPGDRMRPIGLGGTKLISDILIDAHVPLVQKEQVYVLDSDGEVIWLVGHRIAEGYQPSTETKEVLQLTSTSEEQDRQPCWKDAPNMGNTK